MERKRFFQNFSGGDLPLLLFLSGLIIAGVWLLYPKEKTDKAEEAKPAMAALPTSAPAVVVPPQQRENAPEKKTAEKVIEPEAPETEETAALPLYFIWPVTGNLERGYDSDALSYDATMADWRTHSGWDIAAGLGGHVLSAADGTVSAVYTDPLYGTTVEIDHGDGLCSVYANLAAQPTVSVGQAVRVGDIIGAVGESALCEVGESYHLHFAMKLNGELSDPANWLPER